MTWKVRIEIINEDNTYIIIHWCCENPNIQSTLRTRHTCFETSHYRLGWPQGMYCLSLHQDRTVIIQETSHAMLQLIASVSPNHDTYNDTYDLYCWDAYVYISISLFSSVPGDTTIPASSSTSNIDKNVRIFRLFFISLALPECRHKHKQIYIYTCIASHQICRPFSSLLSFSFLFLLCAVCSCDQLNDILQVYWTDS